MRLTGYKAFDWESSGYWYHLPPSWMPTISVEPLILPRPGGLSAFGISTVGQMLIPGSFGYTGALTNEPAILNLFKRLNPADTAPGQLRAVRNDGANLSILAVLQIPNFSSGEEENIKPVNFITVSPFWTATGYSTGTGGFV